MTGTTHGILVGYDGSPGSELALSWAVREARWRGTVLTVCHSPAAGYSPAPGHSPAPGISPAPGYSPAPGISPAPDGQGEAFERAQRAGERNLAEALRFARNILGQEKVQPLLASGPAAYVLSEQSADADMVVVGSRGWGTLPGLLLGSVSQQVCAHASGRVVVVRGHWHAAAEYAPGPVVVGADGSAAASAAIAFAVEEAVLRAAPLLAVCALADTPGSLGGAGRLQEAVDREIARWDKEHPELTILRQITSGQPRTALLDAAFEAQLLVVGDRGRGGVTGMLLGSVSQAMLHHAPCPVGVVHLPPLPGSGPRAGGTQSRQQSQHPVGRIQ